MQARPAKKARHHAAASTSQCVNTTEADGTAEPPVTAGAAAGAAAAPAGTNDAQQNAPEVAGGVGSSAHAPQLAERTAAQATGQHYAVELATLTAAFPDFDAGLISGLLEDQGGDVEEVHAYLKVRIDRLIPHV